jgi:SecD/SecF fusion protein
LITGIVLYVFGSGPIKGFATTLMVGIVTSLFTAIFLTRLIFEWQLKKCKKLLSLQKLLPIGWLLQKSNSLKNVKLHISFQEPDYHFNFSFVVRGFELGSRFPGRAHIQFVSIRSVKVADVQKALAVEFGVTPEVKTFGSNNQVRM